ncbi:MAG: DUF1934 domain-containing protein [Clostridia bacterium]|nr:DUF1934 domain-containing protein [Clostridia bacterium]
MIIRESQIKIKSKIEELDGRGFGMGSPEISESVLMGYYYYSEEQIRLTYTERGEGGEVNTEIKADSDVVTVARSGAIESEIRFKKGEEHSSLYSVPPYKFDMTVNPLRVSFELGADGGELDLYYNMKIGGANKAVRMRIWIQPS